MQLFSPSQKYEYHARRATLAEHLGYDRDARLAIIGADDFGLCRSVNQAVVELAQAKRITSTSLLVPAAAAVEAVALAKEHNLACGVHLTFNSDFMSAPIRPLSEAKTVSSLVDAEGFLSLEVDAFAKRAVRREVELEAEVQLDFCRDQGLKVTHLDSHEGTLQLNQDFIDLYFELAARHRLPLRAGSATLLAELGLDGNWLSRAHEMGLHFPDNLVYIPLYAFDTVTAKEQFLEGLIAEMPPGVTEFYFHPAVADSEARDLLPSSPQAQTLPDPEAAWRVRANDYEILRAGRFHDALRQAQVQLIDFGALQSLYAANS